MTGVWKGEPGMARYGFVALGLMVYCASVGLAQTVAVTLEAASSGDTLTVGLVALPVAGLAGGDLEFSYDGGVLQIIQVQTSALTRSWALVANTTTVGVVKASMASSSGLQGRTGRLLELVFASDLPALESLAHVSLEDILLSDAQARPAEVAYEPPLSPFRGPILPSTLTWRTGIRRYARPAMQCLAGPASFSSTQLGLLKSTAGVPTSVTTQARCATSAGASVPASLFPACWL